MISVLSGFSEFFLNFSDLSGSPPPQIDGPTDYCPAAMNSVYGFCYLAALNSVYNRVSCISFGMLLFLVILMACPFCTFLSEFMNCL